MINYHKPQNYKLKFVNIIFADTDAYNFISVKTIMIEKTDNDDVNDFQPLLEASKYAFQTFHTSFCKS